MTRRSEIVYRRLAGQRLIRPAQANPAELVASFGAVQAQDYAGAKWAVGQRIAGATDELIEQAMNDGAIIRTHVLRPTWHFVAPADVRWMLALTAPRIRAAMAYYDRKLELDEATVRRATAALARALRDRAHLTRDECAQALATAGVDVAVGQRLGHVMMRAELEAVVCSGPRRGKQFTYALLDERVPATAARGRDESLAELTRRYFASRSPATAHDFAWWSGLTVTDARRGIAAVGPSLRSEMIDGTQFFAMDEPRLRAPRLPVAHLLPNYDEYFIGFKDRSAIHGRIDHTLLEYRGDVVAAHVIMIDGRLVGGWRRVAGSAPADVEMHLLDALTPSEQRAVDGAVARYRAFLRGDATRRRSRMPGEATPVAPPSARTPDRRSR